MVDSSNNVYVADANNHRIRIITPSGITSTIAGTGTAGLTNGILGTSQFNRPSGIVIDSFGNIYVGDTNNHCIRKITLY